MFKRNLTILIVLVAVDAIVWFAVGNRVSISSLSKVNQAPINPILHRGKRVEVSAAELPQAFPTDMPQEISAKIDQNFTVTFDNGDFNSKRVYESTKTLEANLKIFQDYFSNKNWVITSTVNQANQKVIMANGRGTSVAVTISQDVNTKITIVSVNVSGSTIKNHK